MKIIKQADKKNANTMNAEGYEFKLCGGSVEPKDAQNKKNEKKEQR